MEEAAVMSEPNFERMSKEEVIAWFRTTPDLSPMLASMEPSTEPSTTGPAEVPMMLASIRIPVVLVEQLDNLADMLKVRRSEVIRNALAAYVVEKTSPVGRDEAEHALDVLRRIVASRGDQAA
jgi:predicted DNA-binding protein